MLPATAFLEAKRLFSSSLLQYAMESLRKARINEWNIEVNMMWHDTVLCYDDPAWLWDIVHMWTQPSLDYRYTRSFLNYIVTTNYTEFGILISWLTFDLYYDSLFIE